MIFLLIVTVKDISALAIVERNVVGIYSNTSNSITRQVVVSEAYTERQIETDKEITDSHKLNILKEK